MTNSATAWISEGLENLIAEHPNNDASFDVVIVGSGYGGSIAADRLSRCKKPDGTQLRVAVLERGKEFLPGMFPSNFSSLAGHVRGSLPGASKAAGNRDGLFDIRLFDDINAVVANGLGGGSLINAGVMEVPRREIFDERWPCSLRQRTELDGHYEAVRKSLGAHRDTANTISNHPELRNAPLEKLQALKTLNRRSRRGKFREAAITVAMDDGPNNSNVAMSKCKLCGDCATGCNFGAKDSLDLNLLVQARRNNARIITGATVLSVNRSKQRWQLQLTHTRPEIARREATTTSIYADRVILAAGALGSTEILLRSGSKGLSLSRHKLGHGFSGNGDMIAVGFNQKPRVNAVADASTPFQDRRIGPTITGIIDHSDKQGKHPVVIEEMAVPGPMRRIFEEIYTSTDCLHSLASADFSCHKQSHPGPDPLAVDARKIQHSSIYAIIGQDDAGGKIRLRKNFEENSDAAIDINWQGLRDQPLFNSQVEQLESLARRSGIGGRILPNPLWKALPPGLDFLVGARRGPLLTVHPLGGCPMGDDARRGVVDDCGRVFTGNDESPAQVHDGLVILDGSIMPAAIGTNPALTIAAVADRAVQTLVSDWGLDAAPAANPDTYTLRPVYADVGTPKPPAPTTMQFAERLQGQAELDIDGTRKNYIVEITLFFQDKKLQDLIASDDPDADRHRLCVAEHAGPFYKISQLRLFDAQQWNKLRYDDLLSGKALELALEENALAKMPLGGALTIMRREPSNIFNRVWRATCAYLRNRGWRDLEQLRNPLPHERALREQEQNAGRNSSYWKTLIAGLKYATRAGEIRLFEYELTIGDNGKQDERSKRLIGKQIRGRKRLAYVHRGNPLRQLMEITLDEFPGLQVTHATPILKLVPEFLARKGLPLFRIIGQQDTPQALVDLISLSTYFLRLIATIHLLSFRAPDAAQPRRPQRLPQALPGVAQPRVQRLPVRTVTRDGKPDTEEFQLTHYPNPDSSQPPVMMIHGYSASGTTFAHPAVKPNLAATLWNQGRDVWILDMRSSAGMEWCSVNFSFEELAYADIPLAVEHICNSTKRDRIDVVAHCMGSAMFAMAVLAPEKARTDSAFAAALQALPSRINRAVLSQVGPLVSLSPANVFRAYLFSYLKHFLPLDRYTFRPGEGGSLPDAVLDRVLAIMPYTDDEFDLENPRDCKRRTAFTSARHRMDLLYGKTFSLHNMRPETLDYIDDLFGPLNIDTATQVAHFARFQTITDHGGNNQFVSRQNLRQRWTFPTFSIHGGENGLADVRTIGRMQRILQQDAGCDFQWKIFHHHGHQDSLVGKGIEQIFDAITGFLGQPATAGRIRPGVNDSLTVQVPWSGPTFGALNDSPTPAEIPLSFGVNPALSDPVLLLVFPLARQATKLDVVIGGSGHPVFHLHTLPPPVDGWINMELPLEFNGHAVDSLLLLLVYDEAEALDNALFAVGLQSGAPFPSYRELVWESGTFTTAASAAIGQCFAGRTAELSRATEDHLACGPDGVHPGIIKLPCDARPDSLRFALSSCQYPPGILDQKPGFRSYRRLQQQLESGASQAPELLLLTGDQIYVDPSAGLFDPGARDERYIHPYNRFYRSSEVRGVLRSMPSYMMLDDHEIIDNWEPLPGAGSSGQRWNELLEQGRRSYLNFQRTPHPPGAKNLWYEIQPNGFNFFFGDTRTDREPRDIATINSAQMFRQQQQNALRTWLEAVNKVDRYRPKFIVCPAMPFPRQKRSLQGKHNSGAAHSDSWDGYPATLRLILNWIIELDIQNLVFLSGDAHLSCIAEIEMRSAANTSRFWSIHSSALYAPLPFANGHARELLGEEQFTLTTGSGDYHCSVNTRYAPQGSGFGLFELEKNGDDWQLSVNFDREPPGSDPAWPQRIQLQCGCAPPAP